MVLQSAQCPGMQHEHQAVAGQGALCILLLLLVGAMMMNADEQPNSPAQHVGCETAVHTRIPTTS